MKAEDITWIDLCYRYGASPAAQTQVEVPLLSTQRFDPGWIESSEPCEDLIELMRYRRGSILGYPLKRLCSEFWLWLERLNFYSLLMLAQWTQVVPGHLPESFIFAARREFGDYPPGRYAESGFPLAGAFLLKLEGEFKALPPSKQASVFHRLLALDASVRTTVSMWWVYWLARLPANNSLSRGIRYFLNLTKDTRELTRVETARVFAFEATWSFLHFCKNLHELLSGIEDRTLAGLIRHYYAYILDISNDHRGSALFSCVTEVLEVDWYGVDGYEESSETQKELLVTVNSLRSPFLQVTNRELWPLPSNLEFLLTDQATQFTH